ncbi:hypothetical protein J4206_02225 [Candidatus Woesearchaeota archaeon]|nr:hypothetical protein [Candidatus Woesearchaeota archaeon]
MAEDLEHKVEEKKQGEHKEESKAQASGSLGSLVNNLFYAGLGAGSLALGYGAWGTTGPSLGIGFGVGQYFSNLKTGVKNTVKDISLSTLLGTFMGGFLYYGLGAASTYLFGIPFDQFTTLGKFAYMYATLAPFMITQYLGEYFLKAKGALNYLKDSVLHPFKTIKGTYNYIAGKMKETFKPVALYAQPFFTIVAAFPTEIAGYVSEYASKLIGYFKPAATAVRDALFGIGDAVYGFMTAKRDDKDKKKEDQEKAPSMPGLAGAH